jgi:PhnB protein
MEDHMSFHPYLFFGGTCREAFNNYQKIFGGDLQVMTMADAPPGEQPVPAESADMVMHASLSYDGNLLMGSDDPTGGFDGVRGMQVAYSAPDAGEAKRAFDALAEGGTVTMPFSETFWSKGFGMCVDRFGTPWMVDTANPGQAS